MTFLEDMYQLMQAAHFRLLSAEDWKTAQAEQFTVSSGQLTMQWYLVICICTGISIVLDRLMHTLIAASEVLHPGSEQYSPLDVIASQRPWCTQMDVYSGMPDTIEIRIDTQLICPGHHSVVDMSSRRMYTRLMRRHVRVTSSLAGAAHVCSTCRRLPALRCGDCCMQFNSPVEVNWEYMDTELMQRFWANHKDERSSKADISDRVLVFHRGISTVRFCL